MFSVRQAFQPDTICHVSLERLTYATQAPIVMSHEHEHNHGHHNHQTHPKRRPIHHDWRFWVSLSAVILMLAAMFMYVASDDESLRPGGKEGPPVPAAE
jgi:hypothetical protein